MLGRARNLFVCTLLAAASNALAEEATIAVATNFIETAAALETAFERTSGHRLTLASGSTGKLYAQITLGAPFDALLSADRERAKRIEESPFGVAGTRFGYARGRLLLWSADERRIGADGRDALQVERYSALAIANPGLAPYGAAAQESLQTLGLWDEARPKIVMGENIGQTFTYVATRNAELGFVALAQLPNRENQDGSYWLVPADLHAPIRQEAVLLTRGEENVAAVAFLRFLRSGQAKEIIEAAGYEVD